MKGLLCVVLVLLLVLIWQCCDKKENFDAAPAYTPQIQSAAWINSPLLGFENAKSPAQTATLLRRLGMNNAGDNSAPKEGFRMRWD